MTKRSARLFLDDIHDSMRKIARYIDNLPYEEFIEKDIAIDAVIRNLEIIGEAAKNVPEKIKEKFPDVPWKRMIGLRNITVHEYFGIDINIIWEIITRNLPQVQKRFSEILKEIKED